MSITQYDFSGITLFELADLESFLEGRVRLFKELGATSDMVMATSYLSAVRLAILDKQKGAK